VDETQTTDKLMHKIHSIRDGDCAMEKKKVGLGYSVHVNECVWWGLGRKVVF
jgi:hypothetical protein